MTHSVVNNEVWAALLEKADREADGHLTVMKFTTNWRVLIGTPYCRSDIQTAPCGKTFAEAAKEALSLPSPDLQRGVWGGT